MEATQLVGIVLLAVLVGAAVPTFIQLMITLRSARRFLDSTGRQLDRALREVSEATGRINRAGSSLEKSSARLGGLFESLADLGNSLGRLGGSARAAATLGGALGPALLAAARAFCTVDGEGSTDRDGDASSEVSSREKAMNQEVPLNE